MIYQAFAMQIVNIFTTKGGNQANNEDLRLFFIQNLNYNTMQEQWDQRYSSEEFIYGIQANEFFKEQLNNLTEGEILLAGEGEGRNAVYAALQGFGVTAFDYSEQGKLKARKLANKHKVEIDYYVASAEEFTIEKKFDLIAIVYMHLPPSIRALAHKNLVKYLKPGGMIVIEVFSKKQVENTSGGPKSLDLLYSVEELKSDFEGLKIELLEQKEIELSEGPLHQGRANVIRAVFTV